MIRVIWLMEPDPTFTITGLRRNESHNLTLNHEIISSDTNIQPLRDVDLAVVTFKPAKSEDCPYKPLKLGNYDEVKRGEPIYILGFPKRAGVLELVSQFTSGAVTRIEKLPLAEGYAISYDATTVGGMSGAPVVNAAGKVIAVHGKTDAEIVSMANSQQIIFSPEQKAQLGEIATRVETVAPIEHFKWGIPINTYAKTVDTSMVMLIPIAGLVTGIIFIYIFIKFQSSPTKFSGDIAIIGPRPSGKLVFLATLAYFPNAGDKTCPVKSVTPMDLYSEELIDMVRNILVKGSQFEPMESYNDIDKVPLSSLQITLKKNQIKYQILNISCKAFAGEYIEDLSRYYSESVSNNLPVLFTDFYDDLARGYLAIIIDATSRSDREHAQSFTVLERGLSDRLSQSEKSKYRIAVIFSHFDLPEVWAYRKDLDTFVPRHFPRTHSVFTAWSHKWGCSVAYFACSAFGMIGDSGEPNCKVVGHGEKGTMAVLKDPEAWKPFGLVAPIYWLLTGKHDKRLLDA